MRSIFWIASTALSISPSKILSAASASPLVPLVYKNPSQSSIKDIGSQLALARIESTAAFNSPVPVEMRLGSEEAGTFDLGWILSEKSTVETP